MQHTVLTTKSYPKQTLPYFLPDQKKSPEIKGRVYGEKVEIVLGLLRQLYLLKVTILQKKFIFAASFVRYI